MSDPSHTTTLPPRFEDADLDHLVVLIGIVARRPHLFKLPQLILLFAADMLERLIIHNDKIPLSPYVAHLSSRPPAELSIKESRSPGSILAPRQESLY
jgi:hypothetical protein